ncbi:pre-16S rRNA-processing nuclease YqgF [Candidatus Uhrbacteria bacterium]|jgi:putative holliday junction resolvase|nr:pre-16S rRNA-processing nuclease YqgF [Candidatus Uhrbacteria bacterium]
MRILGIDYGDKKIGTAFGDSDARIAVPLDVIPNVGEETIKGFVDHVKLEDIEMIVIGVPLSAGAHHGSEQLEKTRVFIEKLKAAVDLPVTEVDEAFTTAESIRLQKEEGAKAPEDALAAMLIIREYFEQLNSHN